MYCMYHTVHTLTAETGPPPMQQKEEAERGTNGIVKLALLRPSDERQKLRSLQGSENH